MKRKPARFFELPIRFSQLMVVLLLVSSATILVSYAFSNIGWIRITRYVFRSESILSVDIDSMTTKKLHMMFSRSANLDRMNTSAHKGLGWTYYNSGHTNKALSEWQAAGLTARDFVAYSDQMRGSDNTTQKKTGYILATLLDSNSGEAWYKLGLLAIQSNDLDQAKDYLKNALNSSLDRVYPSDIYTSIGEVHYREAGESGSVAAYTAFDEAIHLDKFSSTAIKAETYYKRGITSNKLDNSNTSSMSDFQQAIEINPSHAWAHIMLGDTIYRIYQTLPPAEQELLEAIDLIPNDKWPYRYLGSIYLQAGQEDKAIEMFNHVLGIDPDDTHVRNILDSLQ